MSEPEEISHHGVQEFRNESFDDLDDPSRSFGFRYRDLYFSEFTGLSYSSPYRYEDVHFFEKLKKIVLMNRGKNLVFVDVGAEDQDLKQKRLTTYTGIDFFIPWDDKSLLFSVSGSPPLPFNVYAEIRHHNLLSGNDRRIFDWNERDRTKLSGPSTDHERLETIGKLLKIGEHGTYIACIFAPLDYSRTLVVSFEEEKVIRVLTNKPIIETSKLISSKVHKDCFFYFSTRDYKSVYMHNSESDQNVREFSLDNEFLIYSIDSFVTQEGRERLISGGIADKVYVHSTDTGEQLKTISCRRAVWCSDIVSSYYCYGTSRGYIEIMDVSENKSNNLPVLFCKDVSSSRGYQYVRVYPGQKKNRLVFVAITIASVVLVEIESENVVLRVGNDEMSQKDMIERIEFMRSEHEDYLESLSNPTKTDFTIRLRDFDVFVLSKLFMMG